MSKTNCRKEMCQVLDNIIILTSIRWDKLNIQDLKAQDVIKLAKKKDSSE